MRWVEKFKWIMRWYAFHFVTTTIQLYIVLFDCPLMITIFYLLFKAESIVYECGNTHCMIFVSCELKILRMKSRSAKVPHAKQKQMDEVLAIGNKGHIRIRL